MLALFDPADIAASRVYRAKPERPADGPIFDRSAHRQELTQQAISRGERQPARLKTMRLAQS
jgi:hypothetical protein